MTQLRPMALGEIVDRSAAFWRAHWKQLYGLFFTFSLAQYILLKGGQALVERWSPSAGDLATMLRMAAENPAEVQRTAPAAIIGLSLTMATLTFVTLVMTTAAAHWVMPTFIGEPSTIAAGVRHAARHLGTLAGLFVLALLWAALVLVLFLLPGFLTALGAGLLGSPGLIIVSALVMGLGCIGWALWFFLRFALWGPVVAVENVGALAAFRRCDALTSGRVGKGLMGLVKMRLMILLTVVLLLLTLISFISGAPIFILRGVYGDLLDPAAGDVPVYLMVPAELLNLAVSAVMYPLYVAFQTLFYADMRMRREGLDLELALKRLP